MLDTETKGRIDSARDILVGKVPDPKSQVEQITIALIYKFMDDMDRQSEELGGKATFFTGDFKKHRWASLLDKRFGGHERLILYAEGLEKMNVNKNIPQLFRDIFKGVFLPYRDPETLNLFLKEINGFTYDHSERLGDAFEYLLSVLGTQGDAGQFRTPRHIIDFIVAVVDPQKNETVLDPACGTAGFLISAFKHILRNNENLTPDERARLMTNFRGYDIAPDMVRLSRANLYLHGFPNPVIHEYDTLASEERWDERCDVIMANPPFMSPTGGIRPHNRFSIKAKRSEVLFVDYIAEHLNPSGRAGIIVPEGIIFQSQNAYKQLRKMLVENYLWAVVSLPAGVFNPYAGVKTSILFLDKSLAKKSNTIALFKVENDGFGLGAQRRPIDKNDLPQARAEIGEYLRRLGAGESVEDFHLTLGLIVSKEKIAANGEYNLSGERYRENGTRASNYPLVDIQEVAEVASGFGFPIDQQGKPDQDIPFLKVSDMNLPGNEIRITSWNNTVSREILRQLGAKSFPKGTVIFPKIGAAIATNKKRILSCESTYDNNVMGIVPSERLVSEFLYALLQALDLSVWASDSQPPSMRKSVVEVHKIPLPPLEVQKEIVAEIEGCQKIINGARAVLDNYRPHIPIHPDWPVVELGEVCVFKRGPFGGSLKKEIFVRTGYAVYEQSHAIANDFSEFRYFVDEDKFAEMYGFHVRPGELIMSCSGTMGKVAIIPDNAPAGIINQALLKLTPKDRVLGVFLKLWMESTNFQESLADFTYGATIKNVASVEILKGLRLPLPHLATQQAIVAEIEAEQALVAANRELITRFEQKIQATLARVWGEKCIDQRKDEQ